MIYPKFLKQNDLIGITAPSSGVGYKLESFEKSLNSLKENGFNIIETENVRSESFVSSSAKVRCEQIDQLVKNDEVKMILAASGGDFLVEILPCLNLDNIEQNPKWFMGYSDPTTLLYLITTKLDIATLYGVNAGSYDQTILHESLKNNIEIIKGNIVSQNSFELYEAQRDEKIDGYNLSEKVYWETLNGEVNIKGRIIGGCLDSLRLLLGTEFDYTKQFVEKYKEDGFIWYFDIYSMSSEEVYCTLFQMKQAGWFENLKGIIVGRVLYKEEYCTTYQEALKRIFDDIPLIYNADIGHVSPKMTIINGTLAQVKAKNGKGKISFELK